MILAALSNTLRCSILLYEHNEESDNYVITNNAHCIHPVRVSGTTPLFEIKLLKRNNQHYDALVQNFSNGKSKCKYFFSSGESLNFSHSIFNVSDIFYIKKCDKFLTDKYFLPCFKTFVIFCESILKISFR